MNMALPLRCNRSTIANVWRPTGPVTYGAYGLMLARSRSRKSRRLLSYRIARSLRRKRVVRKYPTLSSVVMKAPARGKILSVYSTRENNSQKVVDYKAALAAGDCSLGHSLSQPLLDRLKVLGIDVPQSLGHAS
jgi:hypothetical protein